MNYQRLGSPWLSALLLIALVCSNLSLAATSDGFNNGTLDSKWTFYDPLANSTRSMTGTQASISVPAGSAHDLWTNALNAPRIRQAASNTDFDVVVKVDSTVSLRYQMQGITVEQNNTNLLRFNVQSDGTRIRLFSASFVNGTPTQRISTVITGGVPPYLRVQRVGNQWTFSRSTNGTAWTVAGSYSHTLTISSIGLFSGNAGSPAPAHTALFDSFIVDGIPPPNTSDITPPAISNVQASGVTATSATITWTTNEAANGVMNYGLTASYGTNSSNLAFVTAHILTISGLTPGTLYHYRVWSADSSGNASISTDQTFTTNNTGAQQNSIINWTRLSSSTGQLPVPPVSNGQSGFKVVDLDNNDQIDYVMTLWDATETIVWYRHVGNTFEKYVIDTEKKGISHSEKFNDIDGDGDLDLIIGDASTANTINWWENPYPNYNPTVPWVRRVVRNIGPNFYHDSIWGDFDDDGAEEYIAWNQDGQQLLMFEVPTDPKTSGTWPVTQIFSWTTGGNTRYKGSDAIDINLDGKIDFVGSCVWFEHTGGTNFVRHSIDEAQLYASVEAGQLIPGGRPEVICQKELENAPLNMYEWTGSSWKVRTLIPYLGRGHTLQIGDINGDGNQDILVSEMAKWSSVTRPTDNPDAKLLVLYGDGTGNFSAQTVFKGQGYLEGQLIDIDNDGDLDIITPPFRHNIPRIDMWINQGILTGGDITPPVISGAQIAITDTAAKISWNTDEMSNSSINFGLTAGYGSSHVNSVRALSHSMALTNLLPNTAYNYQLSSVDGSGNIVRSPNFSFITLSNSGNPSGLASDHFTGPLNTSRWTFYDPIGNSSVSTNGTRASISMPAGSAHDLWTNAFNAPRIRQAANNSDFTVEIKLDSTVTSGVQQQGLTIEQDNDDLIRFDCFYDGSVTRIFSASFVNGIPTTRVNKIILNSAPLYLRINRTGNQWTMSYSYNGSNWTVAVVYSHTMAVSSVGIFGGNAGTARPAFSTLVDYFLVFD